jgi:hypothetical protein
MSCRGFGKSREVTDFGDQNNRIDQRDTATPISIEAYEICSLGRVELPRDPLQGRFYQSIESIRDVCFTEKEIDLFLLMTDGVLARLRL